MKMELIPPDTLHLQLQQKLKQLQAVLAQLKKCEKSHPSGHLRVAQKGDKRPQYYHYTTPDDLTGKYIRKNKIDFARALAQKDYDEHIMQILQKEIAALEEYLSKADCGKTLAEFSTTLCAPRRNLITPVTLTNGQYAANWQAVTWTGRPFAADTTEFFTSRGEQVRSKSEILIADALARNNIPYRYEYPIQLQRTTGDSSSIIFHPDFTCLNVRTRAEFYWEHFGRMDDPSYADKATAKLRIFAENGIITGQNLILTMETQTEPLSTRTIEQMIKAYLK